MEAYSQKPTLKSLSTMLMLVGFGAFTYFFWAPAATISHAAAIIYSVLLFSMLIGMAMLLKGISRIHTSDLPLTFWIARSAVFAILILTVVLSYGGENFSLGLGSFKLPVVWLLIAIISILVGVKGVMLLFRIHPILFSLWVGLFGGGIVHLVFDMRHYGLWALRDSTFFLSSIGLPLGLILGWHFRQHKWERLVVVPTAAAVIYGLSYPWSNAIMAFSPKSGVFVEVPLLGFHSNFYLSVVAIWGRFLSGSLLNLFLVIPAMLSAVIIQARLGYMTLPIAAIVVYFVWIRAGRIGFPLKKFIWLFGVMSLLLVITHFIPIPGKLGRFDPAFLVSHMGTILGKAGPAAGSMTDRYTFYPIAIKAVFAQPIRRLIIGNGLGAPIELGVSAIYTKKLHLDYIETIYRTGVVGMLWAITIFSMLVIVIKKTIYVMRNCRSSISEGEQSTLLMICALMAFSTIVSAFEPLFFWTYGAFPYYFYGGLAIGVTEQFKSESTQ